MALRRSLTTLLLTALVVACAPVPGSNSSAASPGASSPGPVASALLGCPPADTPAPVSATPEPTIRVQPNVQVGAPDPAAVVGNFRLCLGPPYSRELVGAAACTWSRFRTEVVSVVGKAVAVGSESLVPVIEVREPAPGRFSLVRDDGKAGVYKVGLSSSVQFDAAQSRQDGTARFGALELARIPGQTRELNGPGTIDAAMSWSCAAAPATDPGFGAGSIILRIDAPIAQEFRTRAACSWVSSERRTWVGLIDSFQLRARIDDKRYVGVVFSDPPRSAFDETTLEIDVTDAEFGRIGDYGAVASQMFVLRAAQDGRSGRLRFLGLPLQDGPDITPIDGPGGARAISGVLDWSCSPAAGAVPRVGADEEPHERESRRGTFELRVDAPNEERRGVATCLVDPESGRLGEELRAELPLNGERVTLVVQGRGTFAGLFRESGDGRYLGEYLNPPGDQNLAQSADDGRGESRLNLPLNRDDPAYMPLGGPGGPAEIDADLSWDCSAG